MAKKAEEKKNVNLAQGTGRRKTATARVYLREGNGNIVVNDRALDDYFKDSLCIYQVKQPLNVTETLTKFDIVITVCGGGASGQAGACRHGISRALVAYDESYKAVLHENGFMTRDPRMVERKKYGQRGARRRFQFSKR